MVESFQQASLTLEKNSELEKLVNEYGRVLSENKLTIRDSSKLPASAEKIGEALLYALLQFPEKQNREFLRIGFIELGSFLALTTQQKKAVLAWENYELEIKEENANRILEKISNTGDVYTDLQGVVLERQAALMKALHRFESTVGMKAH